MRNPPRNVNAAENNDLYASGNARVVEGQKRALELAMNGAPLGAVLEVLVRTVETQSSQDVLASILLLDQDGKHLRHGAAPSLPAEYSAAIDGIEIGPSQGSCGTAAFRAATVVVSDVQVDPLWSAFKDLAEQHQLRACWSTPIFSSQGNVLGTFALYHRVVATPSERDREIVELLAHTAALLVERELQSSKRAAAETALQQALTASHALVQQMIEQCRDTQRALLEMRAAKENAERRVQQLEKTRAES